MATKKNTNKTEPGKVPAADYRQYRETAQKYKEAKAAQEVLEKSIAQYAQEGQQAQEILTDIANNDNCVFDPETGAIIVNDVIRPELDPNSPQFDPVLYNEYATAINDRLKASLEQLKSEVELSAKEVMSSEAMQALATTITEVVKPILDNVAQTVGNVINSEAYKSTMQSIGDAVQYIVDHNEELAQRLKEWEQLQPYLEEELKKPEYGGRTVDDLLANDYKDENGDIITDSLFEKAIAAARAAMLEKALPVVTVSNKLQSVDYPLDKINANIWRLLKDADKTGQITFAVEKRGSKKPADIYYSIDFASLEEETGVTITKKLTAFDKRVYIAAGALYNNGFEVLTVAQIYGAMGNTGRPNTADIKKINDSLTKMRAAHIFLDSTDESKIYKYDKFVYDASLLPMERISAVVNGQTVDSAIHLFREPPLISFARERKQITTISRHLLESPLSKTDTNLAIDDYLLERISHIKNSKGKTSNKLLYTTIYEKCDINTKMQRSRAKEKISRYLAHYKECKFIKDYKEAADGITILY